MSASMPTGLLRHSLVWMPLVHAVEGYITKGAWELTDMLPFESYRKSFRRSQRQWLGEYAGRKRCP